MFKWYRDARIRITYSADVKLGTSSNVPDYEVTKYGKNTLDMEYSPGRTTANIFQHVNDNSKPSEWCSRGWTLQELLAPRDMNFYDMD